MKTLNEYQKRKDYLICVDSDGCAMDTMDIKHFRCFGPCMVTEWDLEEWETPILDRWNEVNLYTMTRGINRFKGLAMALSEINEKYVPITGIAVLQHWADSKSIVESSFLLSVSPRTVDRIRDRIRYKYDAVQIYTPLLPKRNIHILYAQQHFPSLHRYHLLPLSASHEDLEWSAAFPPPVPGGPATTFLQNAWVTPET